MAPLRLLFTGLILLGTLLAHGQRIDSLKRELVRATHDTVRSALCDMISFQYQRIDPDSGLAYAEEALRLARKASWPKGEILALMEMSNNYHAKSMIVQAIAKSEEALNLLDRHNFPTIKSAVFTNLASIYQRIGEYAEAIQFLFKAVDLERQYGQKRHEAIILENMGSIFFEQQDLDKADSFYRMARNINTRLADSMGLARNISNLARVELKRGNVRNAIALQEQALELNTRKNNWHSMQINLANIGLAFQELGEYRRAIDYHARALEISEQLKNTPSIAVNSGNLGEAWYRMAMDSINPQTGAVRNHSLNQALEHLQEACSICKGANMRGPYIEFSRYYARTLLALGRYREATDILTTRMEMVEKEDKEHERMLVSQMESQRDLEQRDQSLLQQARQLEIAALELRLERRARVLLLLAVALLLVVGTSLVLYLRQRSRIHRQKLKTISYIHSHQIRGPLSSLMGLSDLLSNQKLDPEEYEYVVKGILSKARELDTNVSRIIFQSTPSAAEDSEKR